jgi:hypothetical protein
MVKINFEFDSEYGKYRDAIVLADDHGLDDETIEALKQQRFDSWKAHIIAASEVTEEEIAEVQEQVEEQQGEE